MDGASCTHQGENRNAQIFCCRRLKNRSCFGQLDVDENFNVNVDFEVTGEEGVEFSNPSLGG